MKEAGEPAVRGPLDTAGEDREGSRAVAQPRALPGASGARGAHAHQREHGDLAARGRENGPRASRSSHTSECPGKSRHSLLAA